MKTSKSPCRVLHTAYEAARAALPDHRHKYSPRKFTQPQLLACLVLKEFLKVDYRGLAAHLADHPALCWSIGLKAVPHYTAFQKAAALLLAARPGRLMFDAVLERAREDGTRKRRVRLAAVDGTGLESRHVSRHFSKRRARGGLDAGRVCSHFPKVVFVVDCESHMILSAATGRGPGSDLVQFRRALVRAIGRARIGTLLADADFDAEWVHEAVRSRGVRTIVPPTRGRPSDKPPAGRWRRVMKARFAGLKGEYGQRWQVETVNSMIKRHLGLALRADRSVPVTRDHPSGHHSQRYDRATTGFLQSILNPNRPTPSDLDNGVYFRGGPPRLGWQGGILKPTSCVELFRNHTISTESESLTQGQ